MPSSMPSSEPSATPSCTPSSAPTPSPSINLFYPDQSASGKCLNDGGQPAWMESNPSAWLSTTLEICCEKHASWNQQECVGDHPPECATVLWYPDWKGTNKGCLRDGNEPLYMVQNPSTFIFSDKASCCAEHYTWNEASCLGGIGGTSLTHGTSTASSGSKYYADWESEKAEDQTCKNDGAAPEYMINNPTMWLFDQLNVCCEKNFNWEPKLSECKGSTAADSNARLYYPDWSGGNAGCEQNSGTTLAPDTLTDSYFYATLDECCEAHYSWNEASCKYGGSSATTGIGTEKWYVVWADSTCKKDCAIGGTDCGGLAGYYETSNLHDTKADCCSTHMPFDYRNCIA